MNVRHERDDELADLFSGGASGFGRRIRERNSIIAVQVAPNARQPPSSSSTSSGPIIRCPSTQRCHVRRIGFRTAPAMMERSRQLGTLALGEWCLLQVDDAVVKRLLGGFVRRGD